MDVTIMEATARGVAGPARRDERATFTLTPVGALDQDLVGAEVLRHVRLADDVAVFSTEPSERDGVVTYITWRPVSTV